MTMNLWNEKKFEVGDEEPERDFRNKIVIIYPHEFKEMADDVRATLSSKNIPDFGQITDELFEKIFVVLTYALNEKEQTRRLKDFEVISLRVYQKERHKNIDRMLGRPDAFFKYEMYLVGEKWDKLTKEQKIQAVIHELLHLNPDKPDQFKKHDRFDREYELMEKYLEAKNEKVTTKEAMVITARLKKKKLLMEEV